MGESEAMEACILRYFLTVCASICWHGWDEKLCSSAKASSPSPAAVHWTVDPVGALSTSAAAALPSLGRLGAVQAPQAARCKIHSDLSRRQAEMRSTRSFPAFARLGCMRSDSDLASSWGRGLEECAGFQRIPGSGFAEARQAVLELHA